MKIRLVAGNYASIMTGVKGKDMQELRNTINRNTDDFIQFDLPSGRALLVRKAAIDVLEQLE